MKYGWEISDEVQRFVGDTADQKFVTADEILKAFALALSVKDAGGWTTGNDILNILFGSGQHVASGNEGVGE